MSQQFILWGEMVVWVALMVSGFWTLRRSIKLYHQAENELAEAGRILQNARSLKAEAEAEKEALREIGVFVEKLRAERPDLGGLGADGMVKH